MKRPDTFMVLALLVALWGCPKTYPPPTDQVRDPAELRAAIAGGTVDVHSARFKNVRLDYFGEQGRLTVRQLILVSPPDRLRIQTYIPGFDGIAGVLVCGCGHFAYHDRREDAFFYGDASADNVARVLPVGLTCRDVGSLLLGGVPNDKLEQAGGQEALAWDETTGRYKLTIPVVRGSERGSTLEVQVRHGDFRVAGIRTLSPGGREVFTYTAEDFERVAGLVLPRRRRFVVAGGDDFSLTGLEVEVNPELPDSLFELSPPAGTDLRFVGTGPHTSPRDSLCGGP